MKQGGAKGTKCSQTFALAGLVFLVSSLSAVAQDKGPQFPISQTFWENIGSGVLGAFLAAIAGIVIAYYQQKSEPRKRISFDYTFDQSLITVSDEARSKVRVLYNNTEIQDFYSVECRIENTGNMVIKRQFVRFEFAKNAHVLESYFEPKPPPEIGVEEAPLESSSPNEKRYVINHVEPGQSVVFNFAISGPKEELKLHPFNEEGNVKFVPRAVSVGADEAKQVREFLYFFIGFTIFPDMFTWLPEYIGVMFAGFVRVILGFFLLARILPFATVVSRCLIRLGSEDANSKALVINAQENARISIGGIDQG